MICEGHHLQYPTLVRLLVRNTQASRDSLLFNDSIFQILSIHSSAMMLLLHCYLLGDDPDEIFPVEIEETETVGILKDLIKKKKFPQFIQIIASNLKIWRVDLAIPNFLESLEKIKLDDTNSLSPVDDLSEVFLAPARKRVHVIIQCPFTKPG